jgi:acetyl-CoA carboxylase biotin carboxyl carrier protein
MEVREIKTLINLMNDYGLVELEIEDKKGKIRLVRAGADHASAQPAAVVHRKVVPRTEPRAGGEAAAESVELAPNQKLVESPMVGTFYRASSPESPPFVEEGSSVRKGQTLCIIEAMKMMNEIEAPASGRVVKVLIENGQPVQYGQALMILEVG